jgi:hypothetical protein
MGSSSAAAPGQADPPHRQDLPTSLSLLARLCTREETAWRECLTLYAPLVARWCLRNGLGEHDAAAVAGDSATDVAAEFGTTSAAVRQAKSRILRRLKQVVGDLPE